VQEVFAGGVTVVAGLWLAASGTAGSAVRAVGLALALAGIVALGVGTSRELEV